MPARLLIASVFLAALTPFDAAALSIEGTVRGGGEAGGVRVVLLSDRNLRRPDVIVGVGEVDAATGAFRVEAAVEPPVWLGVTSTSAADLEQQQLRAGWWVFPRHEPVVADAVGLVLQAPDPTRMAAAWTGGSGQSTGMLRLFVLIAIGLGVLLAGFFWRRAAADLAPRAPEAAFPTWVMPSLGLSLAGVWAVGLGAEPMDLLEYSYFQEGLRPAAASEVFTNAVSAALAHGPIHPFILRTVSHVDPSPWVLRLPSLLFGVAFVLVTVSLVRREAGSLAAIGAGAVALTAPLAVFYARDATPYALAGLCAAGSVWLILRARDSSRPAMVWAAFAGVHVLGFFTHYAYAFVPLSEALALLGAWRSSRPRDLARALVALCAAAAPAALFADHLEHMVALSGIQFGLISPVYPQSPGLLAFASRFLCVLTSLPADAWPLLLLTLPLWAVGLTLLRRRSPLLGWLVGAQFAVVLLFVVFTHTMSTINGGGRIFYAFRWARPLLLGAVVPLGAAAINRRAAIALAALVALAVWQSGALLLGPARPRHDEARAEVAKRAQSGDAYAVIPAAFYGDPLQYYLADGRPPDLITRLRTADLRVGDATMHGPLAEMRSTLETELDRLHWERVWLFAYREEMLGTPKFDPGVATRTLAWLDTRWERLETLELPYLDVYLYRCGADCAWEGSDRIRIDLRRRLQAERYLEPGEPESRVDLVLPGDATRVTVRRRRAIGDGAQSAVTFEGDRLTSHRYSDEGPGAWEADLSVGDGRTRLSLTVLPPLRGRHLDIEVTRD